MTDDDDERTAAYHEAAHAVVAHLGQAVIMRLRLEHDSTLIDWPPINGRGDIVERPRMRTYFSGYIAGVLIDVGPDRILPEGLAAETVAQAAEQHIHHSSGVNVGDDTSLAAHLAISIFPHSSEDARQFVRDTAAEAERMVRQHWTVIKTVAESLLEQAELSGDQFRAIVTPLLGSQP